MREIGNLSEAILGQAEQESLWSQLLAPIKLDNLLSKMISPVHQPVISSEFGVRRAPKLNASTNHRGIDIVDVDPDRTLGKSVVAPANGTITRVIKGYSNAGNFIEIKDNEGYIHKFMHLHDRSFGVGLLAGNQVSKGTKIAEIGASGGVTGPHLHYEIWKNGTPLNPRDVNLGLKSAPIKSQARADKNLNQTSPAIQKDNNQFNLEKAYKTNIHFSQTLGWKNHLGKINVLISMPSIFRNIDVLSYKDAHLVFIYYVAAWQRKNGFTGKEADGVIGPNTWRKMKTVLRLDFPLQLTSKLKVPLVIQDLVTMEAIKNASRITEVRIADLMTMAMIESGGNQNVGKNKYGYVGLMQMGEGAVKDIQENYRAEASKWGISWQSVQGDVRMNALASAYYWLLNAKRLVKGGVPVNTLHQYLAHQLGAGGMTNLWNILSKNPEKRLTSNQQNNRGKLSENATQKEFYFYWKARVEQIQKQVEAFLRVANR